MTRPLRLEVTDGLSHVIARGNERKAIYRNAADRVRFLEILGATVERFSWRPLAYCLMTNHYHLLVRTPNPTLARGMRDLNGIYAQAFNRRHGRDGHLFQGRYRGLLVERDEHLLASIAYIVRNPVRAGLCASPREWPWSSQRSALGERPPGVLALSELLSYFAPAREHARELYRALTQSEATDDAAPNPEGVIYGSAEFALRARARRAGRHPRSRLHTCEHRGLSSRSWSQAAIPIRLPLPTRTATRCLRSLAR